MTPASCLSKRPRALGADGLLTITIGAQDSEAPADLPLSR
jgi:hypothetical protein